MTESTFKMSYGVSGQERKRLVKAIADYLHSSFEYKGAPSFSYTVDGISIDKAGTLIFSETPGTEEVESLTAFLKEKGFQLNGEGINRAQEGTKTTTVEESPSAEETAQEPLETASAEVCMHMDNITQEDGILTIEMPAEGFTEESIANLRKMVEGRASLLKKSIGTDDLSIEVTDDRICFPWFKNSDPINIPTYTRLISAICKSAKEARRVTVTDHDVSSEKYAFRVWLIRLGFVGNEYKKDRAILMKNLSGTSAFKNDDDARAFTEKVMAKRRAEKAEAKAAVQTAEAAAEVIA